MSDDETKNDITCESESRFFYEGSSVYVSETESENDERAKNASATDEDDVGDKSESDDEIQYRSRRSYGYPKKSRVRVVSDSESEIDNSDFSGNNEDASDKSESDDDSEYRPLHRSSNQLNIAAVDVSNGGSISNSSLSGNGEESNEVTSDIETSVILLDSDDEPDKKPDSFADAIKKVEPATVTKFDNTFDESFVVKKEEAAAVTNLDSSFDESFVVKKEEAAAVTNLDSSFDESFVVKQSDSVKKENVSKEDSAKKKTTILLENVPSMVDDVKPIHTGKTGMQTFQNQQSMAVDLLQNLCKSLDAKPAENDYADDPKGLKVELMPHQKHALKWMMWREHQKPRGGILADDMGLGKTLSMISLVLQQNYEHENDNECETNDSSDTESETDQKSSWIAKGSSRRSNYYGGTLVVCPTSIMDQWKNEVKNRVSKNLLPLAMHHGANRETIPRRLAKNAIVITTYGIVQSESETNGALFSIKWERIILDEAHNIRNHTCKRSIACCKLKASVRWALTGTPVQNKELDLFALLKFLRCRPFDDHSSFKMWISKTSAKSQERLNQVLQALLLRRTKEDLKSIGQIEFLPEKNIEIIPINLTKDEMNVYQKVMVYSQNLFAQFLRQREKRDNFLQPVTGDEHKQFAKLHQKISKMHGSSAEVISGHHILILILRLRQICIHPSLIDAMLMDDEYDNDSDSENAPEIDLLEQLSKLKIGSDSNETEADISTDENLSKASSKVLLRSNPVFEHNRVSSKFQKILDWVREKLVPTSDKGIIVSQFTTVLNMFGEHLKRNKINYVMLTGETKITSRNDIVVNFNSSNSSVQVMLLSLNTGGVGLNLCGANHLFFVDPHWNPQLESQAQDRIYRIGQKKPVHIYKFLCEDTIERRIQQIQESKLQISDQILTGAKRTSTKLTMQDMKTLFEL